MTEATTQTRDAWLGIEVRHLQALAAVARHGSFREAAESLGYVQSAVSQQVAQLEKLIGTRLIERARGSADVALTDSGRLMLEHVDEILARYQRADDELAALADGRTGRLRVGMLQSVATRVLPQVLARFAKECPDVEVLPSESATDTPLLSELEAGELDLAFCELPLPDGPFAHFELIEDPMRLMVAADSPLAQHRGPLSPIDLDGLSLVAYGRWRGQQRALDWLAAQGVHPQIVFTSDHNATVQSLVVSGMGAALGPHLAVDSRNPGTVLLPIADMPPRIVAIAWHEDRELPPSANTFRTVSRTVCHELAGSADGRLPRR